MQAPIQCAQEKWMMALLMSQGRITHDGHFFPRWCIRLARKNSMIYESKKRLDFQHWGHVWKAVTRRQECATCRSTGPPRQITGSRTPRNFKRRKTKNTREREQIDVRKGFLALYNPTRSEHTKKTPKWILPCRFKSVTRFLRLNDGQSRRRVSGYSLGSARRMCAMGYGGIR